MNEARFGQSYFEVLSSVKDQVGTNLFVACSELGLDREAIQKIVFVAQSTVDSAGGNALPALIKSGK